MCQDIASAKSLFGFAEAILFLYFPDFRINIIHKQEIPIESELFPFKLDPDFRCLIFFRGIIKMQQLVLFQDGLLHLWCPALSYRLLIKRLASQFLTGIS